MATLKQKIAFKETGVNGGNLTKAMIKAGYSDRKGHIRTDKLTQTNGWQELMDKHLPDKLLAAKHKALLNKTEKIAKNNNETKEIEIIDTGDPDTQAVSKGLDMAYKLKGKYSAEKHEVQVFTLEDLFKNAKSD